MTEDWCDVCDAIVNVVEEGEEEDPCGAAWWVIRFDCGHEAAFQ